MRFIKAGQVLDFEARSSYSVRVQVTDSGGLSFVRSLNIQVTDVSEVESLKIDSGATQRSVIRSLTITFDGLVSVAEDAFELRKRGVGGGVVNVAFAPPQVVGGKTVVTLTFSGSFSEFGSLVDGEYQLRIFGTRITSSRGLLDGNKDGILGDDYVFAHSPPTVSSDYSETSMGIEPLLSMISIRSDRPSERTLLRTDISERLISVAMVRSESMTSTNFV